MTKRAKARVARMMEMTMRVAGNKGDEGKKEMARATRVVDERMATATARKRAMATKTRLGGAGGGDD